MTIIELTNHNQLPDTELIGYIAVSPEMAESIHRQKYGEVNVIYQVTRGKGFTLFIPKGAGHEAQEREAPTAHQGAPS